MYYDIDLTEPYLFHQLKQIERKEHGKINRSSTTVRRVDGKGRGTDGQGSTLRSKLCGTDGNIWSSKESVQTEQKAGTDILPVHHYFSDYGG